MFLRRVFRQNMKKKTEIMLEFNMFPSELMRLLKRHRWFSTAGTCALLQGCNLCRVFVRGDIKYRLQARYPWPALKTCQPWLINSECGKTTRYQWWEPKALLLWLVHFVCLSFCHLAVEGGAEAYLILVRSGSQGSPKTVFFIIFLLISQR